MSNFIVLDQNELLNVVGGTEEVDIVQLPYYFDFEFSLEPSDRVFWLPFFF